MFAQLPYMGPEGPVMTPDVIAAGAGVPSLWDRFTGFFTETLLPVATDVYETKTRGDIAKIQTKTGTPGPGTSSQYYPMYQQAKSAAPFVVGALLVGGILYLALRR